MMLYVPWLSDLICRRFYEVGRCQHGLQIASPTIILCIPNSHILILVSLCLPLQPILICIATVKIPQPIPGSRKVESHTTEAPVMDCLSLIYDTGCPNLSTRNSSPQNTSQPKAPGSSYAEGKIAHGHNRIRQQKQK